MDTFFDIPKIEDIAELQQNVTMPDEMASFITEAADVEPVATKYYGAFDSNGKPTAFYISDINNNIPDTAVEITEAQWQDLQTNQQTRRWNGSTIVDHTPPFDATSVINSIRVLAGKVITDIVPEWKQRNILARSLEIENIQRTSGTTPSLDREQDEILDMWNTISNIRNKSNELTIDYVDNGVNLTPTDLEDITAQLNSVVS